MGVVLIIVFFASLLLGVPVFISMGFSAFAAFLDNGTIALTELPRRIFSGINSFPLMAIPLLFLQRRL